MTLALSCTYFWQMSWMMFRSIRFPERICQATSHLTYFLSVLNSIVRMVPTDQIFIEPWQLTIHHDPKQMRILFSMKRHLLFGCWTDWLYGTRLVILNLIFPFLDVTSESSFTLMIYDVSLNLIIYIVPGLVPHLFPRLISHILWCIQKSEPKQFYTMCYA